MFSESYLATTITVLTPDSCFYMTSFDYGGKKTRDIDLTCRCHLSNIMPDSIFYDSMQWGMTLLFFLRGGNRCLPQHERDGFSTRWYGETLSYNERTKADGIDYLSMRFQFWSISENSRVEILLRSSSVRICLVVLNRSIQPT